MLGNVCIQYSKLTLTAVMGNQSTNNKLIKLFLNYKYIYTISYGVDIFFLNTFICHILYYTFGFFPEYNIPPFPSLHPTSPHLLLFRRVLWLADWRTQEPPSLSSSVVSVCQLQE